MSQPMGDRDQRGVVGGPTRRRFLQGGLAAAATVWLPAFRVPSHEAGGEQGLPGFPEDIEVYRQAYENWSGEIAVEDVWTSAPRSAADIVRLANWARSARHRLRPRGKMHNWSPLTIRDSDSRTVLVDTTRYLTRMTLHPSRAAVHAQTGATMESLLTYLESADRGFTSVPCVGDITVGGALAIDGHGASIPSRAERRWPGHMYGSLSNLILSATGVVWSPRAARYVLRTFRRDDPRCAGFLTHLGRTFLTEVTLRVGRNPRLRCQSFTDVLASELFAKPSEAGPRSIASYLDRSGRLEVIWYPFTDRPWLKVWTLSHAKPSESREVDAPYNYPFSDNIPVELARLADEVVTSNPERTPEFAQMCYAVTKTGLAASGAEDIWGRSRNVLLYVRPTTLRAHDFGYAILTTRRNVQRVLSELASFVSSRIAAYERRGLYPINMPLQVRVTGLDRPEDSGVAGADAPLLSTLASPTAFPRWDVAVWLNLLSMPGTQHANRFYRELETWILRTYIQPYALARPEWSKGWAYTDDGPWTDRARMGRFHLTFPAEDWDRAVDTLERADPHGIFTSPFLEQVLVKRAPAADSASKR